MLHLSLLRRHNINVYRHTTLAAFRCQLLAKNSSNTSQGNNGNSLSRLILEDNNFTIAEALKTEEFLYRHIGPQKCEIKDMVRVLQLTVSST